MAIALKKWVVAWFGPTCHQEIELFDRGVKVRARAGCSPCWKRSCQNDPMCFDLVPLDELARGVRAGILRMEDPRAEETRGEAPRAGIPDDLSSAETGKSDEQAECLPLNQ